MAVRVYSSQAGAGPFGAIVFGFGFALTGFTLVVGQYAYSIAPFSDPPPCLGAAIRGSDGTRRL
jgi:hypothetical protein